METIYISFFLHKKTDILIAGYNSKSQESFSVFSEMFNYFYLYYCNLIYAYNYLTSKTEVSFHYFYNRCLYMNMSVVISNSSTLNLTVCLDFFNENYFEFFVKYIIICKLCELKNIYIYFEQIYEKQSLCM